MSEAAHKSIKDSIRSASDTALRSPTGSDGTLEFYDSRPEAVSHKVLQEMADNRPGSAQLNAFQDMPVRRGQARPATPSRSPAAVANAVVQRHVVQRDEEEVEGVADAAKHFEGQLTWRQAGTKDKGKKGLRMTGSKGWFGTKVNYFGRWIKGDEKAREKLEKGLNCWEAILFAGMECGVISEGDVKDAYEQAITDAGEDGGTFEASLKEWITGGSDGERMDRVDITKGQLLIVGDMLHVAIALDAETVMSLGHVVAGKPVSGFKQVHPGVAFAQYINEGKIPMVYDARWA